MAGKVISVQQAAEFIKDGISVMVGGFLQCGTPTLVIDEVLKNKTHDLTLIANDTSFPTSDRGKLIVEKRIKKAIVSHIGKNPETGRQMHENELIVELVPQGTLAERIHAGGAGLGGFLTPTGVGTLVQRGKQTIHLEGKEFILEKPLRADVALIYGSKVDSFGNVSFYGTTRNLNPIMAMAADTVIVEADVYCEEALNPNEVVIPGIFIDYIVKKETL